jgi:NAD+ dependent glucose-6-phosphate dehydrogenase
MVGPNRTVAARNSDNDRTFHSMERVHEVFGYDPEHNSAEYTFEGEPKE